jgi:predicted membrane protein
MSISRLIIGLLLLFAGIFFIILGIFTVWWMIFYGIPLMIIGIVILLNKNEDKIEQRKDLKEKKYNK